MVQDIFAARSLSSKQRLTACVFIAHFIAEIMLPFVCKIKFYEKLFDENVDEIDFFCMIVSLTCVVFADVLPTAIVMATKEGSACLLQ